MRLPCPFFEEEFTAAKQRYYQEMADCFMFYKGELCYAVFIGTPTDWSSYYLRYAAFIKDFRNGGRFQQLVSHFIHILKANSVVRIETDIAPSNLANIHLFNKLQFNITGITLSERWGALVHFTKILDLTAEKVFLDQFCVGTRPQTEASSANVISGLST